MFKRRRMFRRLDWRAKGLARILAVTFRPLVCHMFNRIEYMSFLRSPISLHLSLASASALALVGVSNRAAFARRPSLEMFGVEMFGFEMIDGKQVVSEIGWIEVGGLQRSNLLGFVDRYSADRLDLSGLECLGRADEQPSYAAPLALNVDRNATNASTGGLDDALDREVNIGTLAAAMFDATYVASDLPDVATNVARLIVKFGFEGLSDS